MREKRFSLIEIPVHFDDRGSLIEIDFNAIPFLPVRSFVVRPAESGTVRGGHAHIQAEQLLICLAGRVIVDILSPDERGKTQFELDANGAGLWLRSGTWSQQTFHSAESCLLVFSDLPYDAEDYLFDKPVHSMKIGNDLID